MGRRATALAAIAALLWVASIAGAQIPASGNGTPDHLAPPVPPPLAEIVEVVGIAPLAGAGVPGSMVPVPVVHIDTVTIARHGGVQVTDILSARSASAYVSDTQGSAFQPDIQFRGFTGSALLGAPQGLAVYQDGMRLNEPFGDTVQWSLLLPPSAVRSLDVMPGANQLFGLNALGGALSIQTKNGFRDRGGAVQLSAGSFARGWLDGSYGVASRSLSLFVAGRVLAEEGWRDFSPSSVWQGYANIGWRAEDGVSFDVSVATSHNRLRGNGAVPVQLLEEARGAVFTHPDITNLQHTAVSARFRRPFGRRVLLEAVAFARPGTSETFNGDDTDYEPCEDPDAEWLCRDGATVVDPGGNQVAALPEVLTATNNRTRTELVGAGASAQVSFIHDRSERVHRTIAGVSIDGGPAAFASSTELARLTDDRGTSGAGIYDADALVDVETTASHRSLYAATFLSPTRGLTLNGALRFVSSTITLRDQIGSDLDGDHAFTSVNPSAGLTFAAGAGVRLYGSYSVSSRVPSPSELSCADPGDPCRLPNAFASDPPLQQVRAHAVEGGARSRRGPVQWGVNVFAITNRNDLLFVSSGALTNQGYFTNVGDTRRVGVEISASGETKTASWFAAFTRLRAVFGAATTMSSPHHPDAVDGEIRVPRGSEIPGVPQYALKLDGSRSFGRLTAGISVEAAGSSWLRGDEANALEGTGAYALAHLRARAAVGTRAALVFRITNLFDSAFSTYGLLGEADDVLGDDYDDPRFLSPGTPRAAWIGLEVTLR